MGYISLLKCNFYKFPGEKTGDFLSRVVDDCLSKCPNSKKTLLSPKIPGYVPGFSLFTHVNKFLNTKEALPLLPTTVSIILSAT